MPETVEYSLIVAGVLLAFVLTVIGLRILDKHPRDAPPSIDGPRPRRRAVVLFLAALGLVVAAFWYGMTAINDGTGFFVAFISVGCGAGIISFWRQYR